MLRISKAFAIKIIEYDKSTILFEGSQSETKNNDLIKLLKKLKPYAVFIAQGFNSNNS